MTTTDEEHNAASAAEIVVELVGASGTEIGILDESGFVALSTADKHLARAIAVRLVELAEKLPEPPRILRRASDIDDQLRGLEP
ncbi:hypothetical protein [Microbacterium sp. EST19A]|uniref:hypothetical protein n=1 Tax=Microbacterium sp. EST19A TaxID=2862681 RepID=UPI001CBBB2ED|nr:hypothetical protein [Microbacterium sp. EST19A]